MDEPFRDWVPLHGENGKPCSCTKCLIEAGHLFVYNPHDAMESARKARLAALERVAEAAKTFKDAGLSDNWQAEDDAVQSLFQALSELDSLAEKEKR